MEIIPANRSTFGQTEFELERLLNKFDPIGVFESDENWPTDEYDDLILPILEALEDGATADSLAADLKQVLDTDYDLQGVEGIHVFAEEVLNWWEDKQ